MESIKYRSKRVPNINANVEGSPNFKDLPNIEGLPNVESSPKVEDSSNVEGPPNVEALSEICGEIKQMLECLGALMQQSEYQRVHQSLGSVCDEIEAVVGKGEPEGTMTAEHLPQMLVLGQPKCGKSSLINELLGMYIVQQSQSFSTTPLLTKLRYSSKPTSHQGLRDSDKATSTETSLPSVVSLGLASEFVKQSGLEFLDSPGSPESSPVNSWAGCSVPPAVIAYVIDASSGITRDVEGDIREIQFHYTSSQLLFVINKMDASAEVASAAGISQDEAETAMRERVLVGLQRLGCSVALTGQPRRVFCLSCRKLRALRRERLQRRAREEGECSFESGVRSWQENLQSLRHSITNSLGQKLWKLARKASDGLDETAEILGVLDPQLDDLDESKKQAWENIVNLLSALSKDSAKNATALHDRMTEHLLQRKPEIFKAVLDQTAHLDDSHKKQTETVAEIQRLVFEQQMQHCQEFADAELNPRLRRIDDILSALSTYPNPLPSTPVPQFDRIFTMKESLTFEQLQRSGTAGSAPSRIFQKKQDWREKVVKRFMKSVNMSPTLKQATDRLASLMLIAEREVKSASTQAHSQVSEFQDQLRLRRHGLFSQWQRALKLWLQLRSVITEAQLLPKFHWDRRVCIAVGAQGSVVYRVGESNADGTTEGRSMAVKKIVLNDDQFSEMAWGLRYSCNSNNDSLLQIKGLTIRKLSSHPTVWKIHLWTDLIPQQSLHQQLPSLYRQTSLTDRLAIVLSIVVAVALMHRNRQYHGNLRLSNIFICSSDNSVKLSDLHQARVARLLPVDEARQSHLDLAEFPPEALFQQPAADASLKTIMSRLASVDVYCLGVILRAVSSSAAVQQSLSDGGSELDKLIQDCTHRLPLSRPSASDVASRLRMICGQISL